jgi:uncharacterized protein YbjT (DUF2867 family)
VALSIVGAERLSTNGYFRAKLMQERLVASAEIPHTIIRATQFFEFLPSIIRSSAIDDIIRLAPARVQPVASQDVAAAVADAAAFRPENITIEMAGPDSFRLDQLVQAFMSATGDRRTVISDPEARYFGTRLTDDTLVAGDAPRFGHTDFDTWLRQAMARVAVP